MASKNVIIALLALCSFAYGQTRALFVTTNGTVQWGSTLRFDGPLDFTTNGYAATTRSNLSLGLPALTNTNNSGLLSAIGGLATNGSAANLTNFPTYLLRTNGDAAGLTNFPAELLRTNGDGSGLTNLPNANLTNATGVLPLSNGGTGQTNAALAIEALLPAYTNNEGKVLALDTNLALTWTTNAGGGSSFTNSEEAMYGLFFASTNDNRISMFSNGGTNEGNQHTVIGSGASGYGTNFADEAVVIGAVAEVNNGGVAIGSTTVADQGVALGPNATSEGRGAAIGNDAIAGGGDVTGTNHGSVAIGSFATATNESVSIGAVSESEAGGIAIGRGTISESDTNGFGATAVGFDALAEGRGVAVGANAVAAGEATVAIGPNANGTLKSIAIGDGARVSPLIGTPVTAIQFGTGTNTNENTIQIWNAGTVTTNEWAALANATTIGTNLMQATDTTNAQNIIGLTNPATYPAFSNNASKVLAVTTNEAGVEWLPVSNTVTDASLLTNFPASLLTTNGDAAGLTNFPTLNQNTTGTASNVTGVVAVANGGTGASDATNARVNLLPSYTGNENKVLALNSNATEVVWAVDGGGTPDVSTATGVLPVVNGGTGATNGQTALTNLGIIAGSTAIALTTATNNATVFSVAIGGGARNVSGANTVVGYDATSDDGSGLGGVSIGRNAVSSNSAVAIGYSTYSAVFGAAIGYNAEATGQGGAIGYNTIANNGGAIGSSAEAIRGFAGGQDAHASATNSSQIGTGTNSTDNTIQFLSAGTIDTNEWALIAALSTYPTTNISVVGTNNTNTLVFSNGILVNVTSP
jgi:trimeric autotransporter adhesin